VKQRRIASFVESIVNVLVGIGIAIGAQVIIFPWFNIHISLTETFEIALLMTVISIIRSYLLRRLFEHLRVTGLLP
jgi:hypothetical protein